MISILVIDDDQDFNNIVTSFLSEQGYRVASAFNGKEGIARFEDDLPDIVITDIRMPKKDGVDLLLKFRNHPDHQPRGIILMSGLSNSDNQTYQAMLKSLGAHDYLQKPFELKDLLVKIETIMRQS